VQASDIPNGRGDGVPLTTLIDVQNGATVKYCLADNPEQIYLFSGANGYGFLAPLKSLVARPKAGKEFMSLEDDELPMQPVRVASTTEGFVACGSGEGKMLCFPITEVKTLEKGGKGVMLMGLDDADKLSGVAYFDGIPFTAQLELKGQIGAITFGKADMEKYMGRRARKGALLPKKGVLRG
jgi:topoisomerase-4 subunit A